MFIVLQEPPPSVSICKQSIVVHAYCAYLNSSNSQPHLHPDTTTDRKRCTVNVKGKGFLELMGIVDKQRQLDRAMEMTSTRLQASFDKQLRSQAATSQVRPALTLGPSKRQNPPCLEGRYKPHVFPTPPSSEVSKTN